MVGVIHKLWTIRRYYKHSIRRSLGLELGTFRRLLFCHIFPEVRNRIAFVPLTNRPVMLRLFLTPEDDAFIIIVGPQHSVAITLQIFENMILEGNTTVHPVITIIGVPLLRLQQLPPLKNHHAAPRNHRICGPICRPNQNLCGDVTAVYVPR